MINSKCFRTSNSNYKTWSKLIPISLDGRIEIEYNQMNVCYITGQWIGKICLHKVQFDKTQKYILLKQPITL